MAAILICWGIDSDKYLVSLFVPCMVYLNIVRFYPQILQVLSVAVSSEKDGGTIDNVCGALSRMIITNVGGIPINDVSETVYFLEMLAYLKDSKRNFLSGFPSVYSTFATQKRF